MQITKNISAQEVLPKEIWNKYGKTGLRLMDERIIHAMQQVRERQGKPRYFNTWHLDDPPFERNQSGLRIPEHSFYNELSQHSYGRALDSVSRTIPHKKLWQDILDNPDWYWEVGITVVESINVAPTWLHGDCRSFDYAGQVITELLIAEKEHGVWRMFTVPQWKRKYGKST